MNIREVLQVPGEALSKGLLCEEGSVDSSTEEHGDDDCDEDLEDEADGVEEQEEVPRSPLVAGPGPVFTSRVSQRTSAANLSIGSTTGFHNHGEGPRPSIMTFTLASQFYVYYRGVNARLA